MRTHKGEGPPIYGTRELRAKLSEVMNRAFDGEHVEITRHGRTDAFVVPVGWYYRAAAAIAMVDGQEPRE